MKITKPGLAVVATASALLLSGCSLLGLGTGGQKLAAAGAEQRACVMLPDTASSPRWEHGDRPALRQALKAGGFRADIRNARDDAAAYVTMADDQLATGCGVMLLVDLRGAGAKVLAKAKLQGIPVIAYDRPIPGADYSVSFDNRRVGELQGRMVVDGLKAEGEDPSTARVVYMGGDPTDGNAAQFRAGAVAVMSKAGITPAAEPTGSWDAATSRKRFVHAWRRLHGRVDAVWAANDAIAAGVAATVAKQGRTVPLSGQDASPVALRNILRGRQTGTVYKPYRLEADEASRLAIALLKGQRPKAPGTTADGVPFYAERPIVVHAEGVQRVIDDGGANATDVCTAAVAALCARHDIH